MNIELKSAFHPRFSYHYKIYKVITLESHQHIVQFQSAMGEIERIMIFRIPVYSNLISIRVT